MEFEFVKEWIDRGDKEENYIFKFFCYFVAFNWLYNQETDEYVKSDRPDFIPNNHVGFGIG